MESALAVAVTSQTLILISGDLKQIEHVESKM